MLDLHKDTGTSDTIGHHLIMEFTGCPFSALNDVKKVGALLNAAVKKAGMKVVKSEFKHFAPQGISGVVILEESHISIHTWPEKGYAACDMFVCGKHDPRTVYTMLKSSLKAKNVERMFLARGLIDKRDHVQVLEHEDDGGATVESTVAALRR